MALMKDFARGSVRHALGALTRWPPPGELAADYSILLGVPWALRHILDVNLEAISRCDISGMRSLHIVFDRREQPGMQAFVRQAAEKWAKLPLVAHWHPRLSGWVAERANVSTFYNGLNILTALRNCESKCLILHDFDLYPLVDDYFRLLSGPVLNGECRFSGMELTRYDGLTDTDNLLGTWGLAIDVEWVRGRWQPRHLLHRRHRFSDGRSVMLDPTSWLQLQDPDRKLADGLTYTDACHVRNLCSTYLRLHSGKRVAVAWRLHYLVYLQDVSAGSTDGMRDLVAAMQHADRKLLSIHGQSVDFSEVDWTCGNVLRKEITALEMRLHGTVRDIVSEFVGVACEFLR